MSRAAQGSSMADENWKKMLEDREKLAILPTIPLAQCEHGRLYRIHSRNLSLGVFNNQTNGFVGIREKLGNLYLFTEYHWDTGEPHGTASPKEALEVCPVDDLREVIGTICQTCRKPLHHVQAENIEGSSQDHVERWFHNDDNSPRCKDAWPMAVDNMALFNWLWEKHYPGTEPRRIIQDEPRNRSRRR